MKGNRITIDIAIGVKLCMQKSAIWCHTEMTRQQAISSTE